MLLLLARILEGERPEKLTNGQGLGRGDGTWDFVKHCSMHDA